MEWMLYRGLQRLFAMTTSNEQVQLRVHGLGPMDAYHVTEEELILLEREGNDIGLDFQFAQLGLTVGFSFLASLMITPIPFGKVYVIYVVVTCVGFVFGLASGIRWLRNRGKCARTYIKIRSRRFGPAGTQDNELTATELVSATSPAIKNPAEPKK